MAINKIKPDYLAGIFILLIFITFTFYRWPLLESLDSYLYRVGSKLINNEALKNNEIKIINVGPKNIHSTPGDRTAPDFNLAELAERLTENGVKLIAFCCPFKENTSSSALKGLKTLSEKIKAYPPGNESPRFKDWVLQNIGELKNQITSGSLFIETIKDGSKIIFPVSDIGTEAFNPETVDYLNSPNISPSFVEKLSVDNLFFPYPELIKDVAGYGYFKNSTDDPPDRKSFQVYAGYKNRLIPCLALRIAIYYYGLKPLQVEANESKIVIKDAEFPLVKGRMYIPVTNDAYSIDTIDYEQLKDTREQFPDLKDKIVIIGFKEGDYSSVNDNEKTDAEVVAIQLINIFTNRAISRSAVMIYLEFFIFILIVFFLIYFTSSKGHMVRSLSVIIIILLLLGLSLLCFSLMGIWLKTAYIIFGSVLLYLFLWVIYYPSGSLKIKSHESSRVVGLNLQSQGELDLAYEEFKTLPLDKETKDLIYNLGLEYEKKKLTGKALELYTYINKTGGFRDLDDRIPILKESDYSSTMGSYDSKDDSSVLGDSSVNSRAMVGRYKVIGQLGKGSMGLVYKAQDPKINRLVAIKTIRFSDEFDEDVINEIKERFFMEAEIAGKLNHPAIVTIHDVGDDHDLTYMAMEYLEGEDLDNFIKKENLLPFKTVLDVVAQIAEALDFAHKEGVIHRDIKPANVMLLHNGQVKVTDFGIAKAISSSKTKTGVILGTPNYMSPEQIMGQKIDSRSDIFSLGVLFYQLLSGELPFHGDNLSGLLYQITQVKHPSPRNYNQRIPKVCEQILDKALLKDPAKRFRTAGDMANILRALIEKMDQLKQKKMETAD